MKHALSFGAALSAAVLLTSPAWAQSGIGSGIGTEPIVTLEVLDGWPLANGGQMMAFHFQLADGWKTYWRSPGSAGIPPRFDWTGSRNLEAVQFLWPRPRVFDDDGLRTVGYSRELVLPVALAPRAEGTPVSLSGKVEIGVCLDVCVPVELDFAAALTPSDSRDARISDALSLRPVSASQAHVSGIDCVIEPIDDGMRVTATIDVPSQGANETAIIEAADPSVWVSDPVTQRKGDTITVTSDLVPVQAAPFFLQRSDVTITVLGDTQAAEIRGCSVS